MSVISRSKGWFSTALLATCALLNSCSDAPKTAAANADAPKEAAPAVLAPVSAKTAYWEMYAAARKWSTDAETLEVQSKSIPGVANEGGKAAMWTATFASPSKSEERVFTYAIETKKPDIYKGVTIGEGEPWNGPSRSMLPFQMSEVATDSDAAYKTAETDAGKYLKEHPGETATFTLRSVAKYSVPTWAVLFGDEKKGYRSLVNGIDGTSITKQ